MSAAKYLVVPESIEAEYVADYISMARSTSSYENLRLLWDGLDP